jgi:hypothetical protein
MIPNTPSAVPAPDFDEPAPTPTNWWRVLLHTLLWLRHAGQKTLLWLARTAIAAAIAFHVWVHWKSLLGFWHLVVEADREYAPAPVALVILVGLDFGGVMFWLTELGGEEKCHAWWKELKRRAGEQ